MKIINTDKAPAAIGPYNQAVEKNGMVYLSGQIPINPSTGEIVQGGIEEQSKQVFENIKAVLNEAQLSASDIIKTTCFLTDLSQFQQFNAVYATVFEEGKEPARSTVEVSALPKGVMVEVEVIAVR